MRRLRTRSDKSENCSKAGIWLKKVDKDDGDIEYKHYQTNCSGGPVIKDAEIEVEHGYYKRKTDHDAVDSLNKADAIRSLICRWVPGAPS